MLSCCLLIALTPAAPAEPPRLRQLCIRAPLVVLARPADPEKPSRFTVLAVLRGRGVKTGDELRPAGLGGAPAWDDDTIDPETKKPRRRRIETALLFLEPAEVDGMRDPYRVMPAGYRFCTDDGLVLVPNPPRVNKEIAWPDLLRQVRGDLDAVDRLRAARRIAKPSLRVRAVSDWVQRRRGEMAQSPPPAASDLIPGSWYELATDVFDWMFADASPHEAWGVVLLYASLHRGEVPRLKSPVFATAEGRALLLGVALDGKQLAGDRARALRLLAASVANCEEAARGEHAKKLAPLLRLTDETMQVETARALVALAGKGPAPHEVLGLLPLAYQSADPGAARDELALALQRLAPNEYASASGNPAGVCVRLTDFQRDGDEVTFFVDLRTGAKVYERPTLIVEKLGLLGFVAETKKVPLEVLNLDGAWADGVADTTLGVRVRLSRLITAPKPEQSNVRPTPTLYRFRVEGSAGKDKQSWRSEPKLVGLLPGYLEGSSSSSPSIIGD